MILKQRIDDFVILGKFLKQFVSNSKDDSLVELNNSFFNSFEDLVCQAKNYNGWFTQENVRKSLEGIYLLLNKKSLINWVDFYNLTNDNKTFKTVGVIMAGNIPLVGFHDFLCVLISGNKIKIKLSSNDNKLFPAVINVLISINKLWENKIEIVDGMLKDADAIIATGSNNSARYFDYYFGKYKHIIRKNRNSVAVLSGNETNKQLKKLSDDVFLYFGLGCRSVSKIFIPKNYNLNKLFEAMFSFKEIINHNKYANNYDYNKTVYLLNNISLLENGFMLFKQDTNFASPVAVLFYEFYDNLEELIFKLDNNKEQIQCIVSNINEINNKVDFGNSQLPNLFDYADDVDVMTFLNKI